MEALALLLLLGFVFHPWLYCGIIVTWVCGLLEVCFCILSRIFDE